MSRPYPKIQTYIKPHLWMMLALWICATTRTNSQTNLCAIECARLDTLEVHPLQTVEDVIAFTALLQHEIYGKHVTDKTLNSAFKKAAALNLLEERALLAFYNLNRLDPVRTDLTEQIFYANIISNQLDLLPQETQSKALNIVGNTSLSAGDHTSALAFYQRAYETAIDSQPLDKLYPLGNLAATYLYNQDTLTALQIIHRSIKLVSTLELPEEVAYNNTYDYSELGNIYLSRKQTDSAKHYLTLAAKSSLFFEPDHKRYKEIQETLMPPFIRFQIKVNNHQKVEENIDSIRSIFPQLANLLEAEYYLANNNLEKALSLTNSKFEVDLSLDKVRIELRRDLATKLGRFKLANQANSELLAISEGNLALSKKALVTISKAQMDAFEKEHENDIAKFETQIDDLKERHRTWIALLSIIVSFGIALWFNQQYRKSKQRSLNLSKIVTEHERNLILTNKQLAAKVRSMERFNHLLSHDLREPLRSISGFAYILKRKAKAHKELDEDFNILSRSIEQLTHLMSGVEELRRVEEKSISLSEVDLQQKIDQISKQVTSKYNDRDICINVKGDLAPVLLDKDLLFTSLLELVDNAAKFCRNTSTQITIEVLRLSDELVIYVQDEGIGMELEFKDQIFGLFKRLNRRENFVGSGVGLTLAKLAAEKSMGRITLLESTPGKGSTFQLVFPLTTKLTTEIQVQPLQHAW